MLRAPTQQYSDHRPNRWEPETRFVARDPTLGPDNFKKVFENNRGP